MRKIEISLRMFLRNFVVGSDKCSSKVLSAEFTIKPGRLFLKNKVQIQRFRPLIEIPHFDPFAAPPSQTIANHRYSYESWEGPSHLIHTSTIRSDDYKQPMSDMDRMPLIS